MDIRNKREDDCEADDESNMEPGDGITASESPKHRVLSAALHVAGLIQSTWRWIKQAERGLVTVSATETRRNKGNKKL